jgi:signal transduction histidine kinase
MKKIEQKQLIYSILVSIFFTIITFAWWQEGFALHQSFDRFMQFPMLFPPIIQLLILLSLVTTTAFLGEKFGIKKLIPYILPFMVVWNFASIISIKVWNLGLYSIPTSFAICSTLLVIHLKKLWRIDHLLTKSLLQINSSHNLLEGKSAESRVESGLKLLETLLPNSEAVVFHFDENTELKPIGRLKSRQNSVGESRLNEWREDFSLCELAVKNWKNEMRIDELGNSAKIALPLISNGRIVGVLFINIKQNFQNADLNLLDAFCGQFARNFHRQELRHKRLSNESVRTFFSTQFSENRVEMVNLHQGLLREQSFSGFAISQLKEAHAIAYLDGTLAYLNSKMRHLADLSSNEAINLDIFELLNRFKTPLFSQPQNVLRKVFQTGESFTAELHYDETDRTLDMEISLVRIPCDEVSIHDSSTATKPACFLITFRDITAIKENEKLRSDMASLMSHELRTPITSIKGFAELLLIDDNIPAESKEFLAIIANESQRLAKMLSTFLSVSNLEQSDKQEFSKTPVKLDNLVHEVVSDMQETAKKKRIYLVEQATATIPPIAADKGLIRRALSHLIDNAIKYSPDKSSVIISTLLEAEALRVTVEDRGYGIPASEQEKIWEKFYRVAREGQDKEDESTGLGLSLVKEIVEQHGGEVQVKSKVGQGSRFSFTLPRL